ncbi:MULTISPECIES: DUF4164 domain-containing protein [Bartonella]|uniref:DUF4164 family protein n=1 Tax=Bartonella rochalimae ATCC BAA-1498 TaxID=685782 RepID=E6YNE4_9HYPH|nr:MULTISPECIES: DUF4164 domain-containing protein [Bartonella]AQX18910.1 protein of unknown function (DUF4164) [Bartonella sp. A1379B]AQX22135.1 protein of unknown function (DUF4164) [Bartonella sp. 11B]AQX24585.1 protein of unknown function (DUF4164) [Bartonella sp. 114]AQX25903.1 protein of unknown function (DUF4164) [Bartonella sp. Coyote22sub2]KEC54967.1 hypothetical protein O99_00865 [Bartonella rochalimae ATCC BAA-1498]
MNQETVILPQALEQLEKALRNLEVAVINHNTIIDKSNEWEEEIQRMNADRSRLAQELDKSEAQTERLTIINKDVSKRLIKVMETIRVVVDR